ncbi:MAG TPA: ankyrin repeat domain-containing protein [Bacteroidales bacterium]|nr:ankyrin repeat domain-containing protein [Bacteroidales bacterium]
MKTHYHLSMKTTVVFSLITLLFVLGSCSSQQSQKTGKTNNSVKQSESVKAPDTDIQTAALTGNLPAIQQHIAAGTDLNVKEPAGGSTPLITATVFGKTDVALALIRAGADVNLQNNDGSTALHSAAFFCRTEILKALLENGADKQIRNNFGSTALESVTPPFEDVKEIYDQISKGLGPFGLKLNYSRIERTRPEIAALLK